MKSPLPLRYISKKTLRASWKQSRDSKKNAGKPGVDWISAASFGADLENKLGEICRLVKAKQYRFQKLRPVFIPKPNSSKERLICIPTVRDRLVQRCIAGHLERHPRLKAHNEIAHGFIKGRGVRTALEKALELRGRYAYAIKTDICSFFDCIPRDYVKELIRRKLGVNSLVPLLDQVIDQEIADSQFRDKLQNLGIRNGLGIRQGMPLSPLLSNIALSDFDAFIDKEKIEMVRYADDIIAFFPDQSSAQNGFGIIEGALAELNLKLPPIDGIGKSGTFHSSQPIDFLGREIVYLKSEARFVQRISKAQLGKIRGNLLETYSLNKLIKEKVDFADALRSVNASVSAYLSAYKNAANYEAFRGEMHRVFGDVLKQIFTELFTADAVNLLDERKRKFLGLNLLVLSDDFETEFGEH